jgi:acetoacetate decarboxylase
MPALFGPSLLPDRSFVNDATVASISFETEPDAAAALLPRFFAVSETPLVTVTYINYPSLEYMCGRGYQELVVAVAATHRSKGGELRANFAPVMWVDQAGPLISGREYMGFAKLLGTFETERGDEHLQFRCREYDSVLVQGTATRLTALADDRLARINDSSREVITFGWKYIASDGAVADADYATANVMRWVYKRAWSAEGRLEFHPVPPEAAPLSSRVIDVLSKLPVRSYRRAFVAQGDAIIDRTATRRL